MKRFLNIVLLITSALFLRAQDYAPNSPADSIFSVVINRGTYPMASSGSVVRMMNSDGTYLDLLGSAEVGTTSGTYTYTKTGSSTAKIVFTSNDVPTNTAYLTFSSNKNGTYTLSVGAVQNMQSGTFALIETAPPFVNVSTRMSLAAKQHVTAGFIISGTIPRTVLIRAIGPNMFDYGVVNHIKDPKLDVFSGTTKIYSNDNWGNSITPKATLISESARVWAAALKDGSADAALIVTLQPGPYTVEGSATTDTDSGDLMLEVFLLH